MIPLVALTDLAFALVILAMHRRAPTPKTRKLTIAVFVYVLIEAVFHVQMEAVAADCIRLAVFGNL